MNKMMKWLGVTAMSFGLFACSENVAESKDVNVDAKGNLYVTLRDVNGNLLTSADSVNVTLLKVDKTPRTADSLGTVAYKDLQVGTYSLLVEKTGYSSMVCAAYISMAATDETPIAQDLTLNVALHKAGATVSGSLVRNNNANINGTEILPAASAIVRLAMDDVNSCYFVNSVAIDTTDAAGNYSITGLPELADFSLVPQSLTVNGELYSSSDLSGTTGAVGESKRYAQLAYNIDANPFQVVSSNAKSVAIDDSVVVNFSKAVDITRLRLDDIKVSNGIAITTAWSNNNTTLTVKSTTGKWASTASSFSLIYNIYSLNGQSVLGGNSLNVSVFTDGDLAAVTNFAYSTKLGTGGKDSAVADANTGSVHLKWSPVANAAGYEIYARKSTDSSFFVAETIYSPDTSVDMTTTNDFQDKKNVSFFVVAFNSLGRSNYATAPGLKIADGYKPVATNLPLAYTLGAVDVDLTAETDTTWLVGRSFTFSEKMDTTKAPTLTISTAVATELGATYKWVNPTTLQIVLYAKAKVDLTEAATPATYSITAALNALTDVAGNTYEDKASGTTYTFTFTN